MDFGSKYVYKYEHSSDESVSDDEDDEIPKANNMLLLSRRVER
jgi:hypothetical protein